MEDLDQAVSPPEATIALTAFRQGCLGRGEVVLVVGQPARTRERRGPDGQLHIVDRRG